MPPGPQIIIRPQLRKDTILVLRTLVNFSEQLSFILVKSVLEGSVGLEVVLLHLNKR